MNIDIRKYSAPFARRGSSAFTLIEVLLVIVILMMLATVLVVYVLPQQKAAEKNTTRLFLQQVQNALDTYRLNIGHYPTEDEGGLTALMLRPSFENERLGEKWQGPYLKPGTRFEDAWGNGLIYEPADSSEFSLEDEGTTLSLPYKLYSMGEDGQPETDDDIALVDETALEDLETGSGSFGAP
ncbi:MAG: type II secretion system major pseudopilin GspG [Limisphaerales bacterium]